MGSWWGKCAVQFKFNLMIYLKLAMQTSVGVAILASQQHAGNFKHPDDFIPERFLGDPEFELDKRHSLQPFSIGPRNCLGCK